MLHLAARLGDIELAFQPFLRFYTVIMEAIARHQRIVFQPFLRFYKSLRLSSEK